MYFRSYSTRELFNDFERVQRELQRLDGRASQAIRGAGRGGFPALNVGSTPDAVEVFAFAPGLDAASIDVQLERGVLTLSGQRPATTAQAGNTPSSEERQTQHINERFDGRFRRVVNLPDDIDPQGVSASYTDGVLRVTVPRRAPTQPRKIEVH